MLQPLVACSNAAALKMGTAMQAAHQRQVRSMGRALLDKHASEGLTDLATQLMPCSWKPMHTDLSVLPTAKAAPSGLHLTHSAASCSCTTAWGSAHMLQ